MEFAVKSQLFGVMVNARPVKDGFQGGLTSKAVGWTEDGTECGWGHIMEAV